MQTLIFDIDGTLTNMAAPELRPYPAAQFIQATAGQYHLVYATGGTTAEADYALTALDIKQYFDIPSSISSDNHPHAKTTGHPLHKLLRQFPDALFITDSPAEVAAAERVGLPALLTGASDVTIGQRIQAYRPTSR